MRLDRILHGDSISLMREMPEKSADLIFADPPYNLQLKGELLRPNQSRVSGVEDAWDKFGSFAEYDHFTREWLTEAKRVMKDTGSIWVIGTYHNIFRIGAMMQDLGFWILNDVIWAKSNPMPNFKGTRFTNATETLIWAKKSEETRYNFHYQSMKGLNEELQMRNIWEIPLCTGKERLKENGKKAHATQKPEALLYRVILSSSNPGDLVLDPFAGTGTSLAVAKKLGRRFIGMEREAEYVRLASQRLDAITPAPEEMLEQAPRTETRRIPFGNLLESGQIQIGQLLYAPARKFEAQVLANARIRAHEMEGSIHQVGAKLQGLPSCNGWNFWHVEERGELIVLDRLRQRLLNPEAAHG